MATQDRDIAIDAVDALNDLVGDFVTGSMLFREWEALFRTGKVQFVNFVGVQKMCLSYIVLGLCKFLEFYERFHSALPNEHRANAKAFIREIRRRGVPEFRNKFVGHIWDIDQGRPLRNSEVMDRITTIAEGDLQGFLAWINAPKANVYPTTAVSIVETIRDAIAAEHSIQPHEVINR